MKVLLAVFLGGGVGSVLRFLIGRFVLRYNIDLPVGTFMSNMLSCIIVGMVLMIMSYKNLDSSSPYYAFLIIGLCGGLSTFSTFSLETYQLLKQGNQMAAIFNIALSLILGICLIYVFLNKLKA